MHWRKTYPSMYDGSLVGAGAMVFAVMNYIVSKQEYHRETGEWRVRLNPKLLGVILGEKEEDVEGAIKFLCRPDRDSTSKREEGRRIVPVADHAMEYRVVNGDVYQDRRDYEERKEQNREAQRRYREKKSGNGPSAEELRNLSIAKVHGQGAADADFDRRQQMGIV